MTKNTTAFLLFCYCNCKTPPSAMTFSSPPTHDNRIPKAESLTEEEWLSLMNSGQLLEVSAKLGPKVSKLDSGEFVKLLRVKRRLSIRGLTNPAKRYARNAKRLQARGISTPPVERIYRLPHLGAWAIRYPGIEGDSLSALIQKQRFTEERLTQLISFILKVHNRGVYFRGLHMGNIILTPNNELGLIDILDCRFSKTLSLSQRKRNFKHLFRYADAQPFETQITQRYFDLLRSA